MALIQALYSTFPDSLLRTSEQHELTPPDCPPEAGGPLEADGALAGEFGLWAFFCKACRAKLGLPSDIGIGMY